MNTRANDDDRLTTGCASQRSSKGPNTQTPIQKNPCDTHTHTPPRGEARKTKVRANAHMRAQQRQKDEDMKRRQDRTERYVVAMKGEPSAQGQPMNPTSLSRPGQPET